MRKNILQPSKHTESVKGGAGDDIKEKIVPIFVGAAVMALIIVLLLLVLGVMYFRNWRRWGNYLFKHSFIILLNKSNFRNKCSKSYLKARSSSHHKSLSQCYQKNILVCTMLE